MSSVPPDRPGSPLEVRVLGTTFQNPVLLAAGTCGFGRELREVMDLDVLGGLVSKSVTLEPRRGNPPPRVAEFGAGMINSVGLANPGLEVVRDEKLPWLRETLRRARVLVSVAGHTVDEYVALVEGLAATLGFVAFELNLSCPNDSRLGGRPFALDPAALEEVVRRTRAATDRPLVVKLAPNDPALPDSVRAAERAGADALTLVNTLPGMLLDERDGRPLLGAGQGGVSGPALRAAGLRTVAVARGATDLPLIGVGGIATAAHAVQYLRAGATLVQVGTASFADPRAAERIVADLPRALRRAGAGSVRELLGVAADGSEGPAGNVSAAAGVGAATRVGGGASTDEPERDAADRRAHRAATPRDMPAV